MISNKARAGIAGAVALLALSGCGLIPGSGKPAPTPSMSTSMANTLMSATVSGKMVVTNAAGYTLYSFSKDTSSKSNCNGVCDLLWPPVMGPVMVDSGTSMTGNLTGTLGTVTRADGTMQATYNGHPLYNYIGDTSPGQNRGNGMKVSGGTWREVLVTELMPPAPMPAATHTSMGNPAPAPPMSSPMMPSMVPSTPMPMTTPTMTPMPSITPTATPTATPTMMPTVPPTTTATPTPMG